jgi:hypothetical protein
LRPTLLASAAYDLPQGLTVPSCANYAAPRFAGRLRYAGAVQVETVENSTTVEIIFGRNVNFI